MTPRNHNDSKIALDRRLVYQILVPGALDRQWLDWNGGLEIWIGDNGQNQTVSVLRITADQAGLHGLLMRLYSLGLPLISVRWADYSGTIPEQEASTA